MLVCAALLDAALGEPDWLWRKLPHPAVLMGRLIASLDRRFNDGPNRKFRGVLCVAFLIAVSGTLGWCLTLLGPVVEVVSAAILLAHRSLVQHVQAVADGLRISLSHGRKAVSMIVSRNTEDMQTSGVARSAIESAAENMSDGVIAPAFWFLIGGLPGIMIYKMVNTADSMIGYRTSRYMDFGWAAARLDDGLNLLPARLTALLLAVSGSVTDIKGIRTDAGLHRSPNAGWPEAALSRALGIALAGPRTYDGTRQDFPWVNARGRKDLNAMDIENAIGMLWRAWMLMLVLVICMVVVF